MTQPWPDDLIDKIGLMNIVSFRSMPRVQVAEEVLIHHPDIKGTDLELVLSIALPDEAPRATIHFTAHQRALEEARIRGVFFAAAWEAGASWDQLGKLFDIARQSAAAAGKKFLPDSKIGSKETAQRFRISKDLPSPSLSTVAAWRAWYYEEIVQKFKAVPSVLDLAAKLLTIRDE